MGLCKCPKKKMTTQFCFEHRVNVCEHCMVGEHTTCVVQSYRQWLSDSDYNPVCRICDDQLAAGECIRLVCYDLFHKECLNDWASRLPPDTAPAGYKCPVCSKAVFPPANLVSPIADRLRETLAVLPWARTGLGLPLIENSGSIDLPDWSVANGTTVIELKTSDSSSTAQSRPVNTHAKPLMETTTHTADTHTRVNTHDNNSSITNSEGSVGGNGSSSVRVTAVEDPPITSQYRDGHHSSNSSVARKGSSSETRLNLNGDVDVDDDENKYKRRSAIEWFSRWWRTMSRPPSRHHQTLIGGRRRMIIVLVLLACATLLVVLSYLGHGASDNDPLLDPFNNPNIHVEGE
ncbi:zinc finger protein-like 1 homolog [Homarus americanus]|uniref:Zinc finger protein-like 1 homolog n=1 Tax=Homarus americanus TaxID=6706 RepID=A0A8J5JYX4_HOMAM|nr:zinc finger protein-like 1 homolog [Homarus americanus]KAG7161934.1 Zinc finger protein-like 1-like [Homarus americanus]